MRTEKYNGTATNSRTEKSHTNAIANEKQTRNLTSGEMMNHPITLSPHHLDSFTIENAPAIVIDEVQRSYSE
jgi:hypothetical protein